MIRSLSFLLSVISLILIPIFFEFGWLEAVMAFTILGGASFTVWAFIVAKKVTNYIYDHSDGYNPFLD